MNPFNALDIVGHCAPGVGANKAEPAGNDLTVREPLDNLAAVHEAARTITVESVLADLLSLSLDDRSKVKMGLFDATRPVGDPRGAQTVRDIDQFELMHAHTRQAAPPVIMGPGVAKSVYNGGPLHLTRSFTTSFKLKRWDFKPGVVLADPQTD